MQKRYALTLLCCLFFIALQAQVPFAPLGAHWTYTFNEHSGGLRSTYEIRVTHDTLIGNTQVKTLTRYEEVFYAMPPLQFYSETSYFGTLSYRNDSVFCANCLAGTNGYLFEFGMKIGDTIPMWAPGGAMYGVVIGVDSVLVGTTNHQRWQLDKYCDAGFGPAYLSPLTIIEGIGPVDDLLNFNAEGCQFNVGWWDFACYTSPDLQYNGPCPALVLATPEAESAHLSLAPNPARDQARISGINAALPTQVTIIDLQGRRLYESWVNGSSAIDLQLAHLPQGMYQVRIEADGRSKSLPLAILR